MLFLGATSYALSGPVRVLVTLRRRRRRQQRAARVAVTGREPA
jgi:hypothetical protein